MTEALTPALGDAIATVIAANGVERFKKARAVRQQIATADQTLRGIEGQVAVDLKEGRTWAEVGALLGVTGSRAEQISRNAPNESHAPESTPGDVASP